MKRLIIYFLCIIIFLQSSLGVFAEEFSEVPIETSTEETPETFTEETSETPTETSTEELIKVIEKIPDTENSISQNVEDDPQYGRANGYTDSHFYSSSFYTSNTVEYVHNPKYVNENYTIHETIDVSKYQGKIDWVKVKESGINYAFIRAGFRGYGETGSLNTDEYFFTNIQDALSAGLKVGVYFFSQAITVSEATAEAEYVLDLVDDYELSLPIVIDFEYASSTDGLTGRLYNASLTTEQATEICSQFCSVVEQNGYPGMVYANKDMLENGLNANELSENYKIWLSNYGTSTSYEGDYEYWQYTQNGTVNGIEGNVDKSFWYQETSVTYTEVQEGIYSIETFENPDYVVDISGESLENNANIKINAKCERHSQKFYIRPENNAYIIMSIHSGKVLENRENIVVQNNYSGSEKQLWNFIANADGSCSIKSIETNQVMDAAQDIIQLKKFERNPEQKFILTDEQNFSEKLVNDGVYFIETALKENKVISVDDVMVNPTLSTLSSTDLKKFTITYAGNGCYKILAADGKALTVGDGINVFFSEETNNLPGQRWLLKQTGSDLFTILSAQNGKCLDVAGGRTTDGTIIKQYTSNGSSAQKYRFWKTSFGNEVLDEGIYIIHSASDDTKVLDIYNQSKSSNANVQLSYGQKIDSQKFIIRLLANGNYNIISYHSQMALAVANGKNVDGTNVYQFYPTGGIAQEWTLVPVGKGYYNIVSCTGDKVLDIAGGKTVNGANIYIYTSNDSKTQRFRFEKIGEIPNETSKTEIADGTYTICSALNETKVLDVSYASLYAGANVHLYSSSNTRAQQFVVQKTSSGLYTIKSQKSGMHLVYENGIPKNSANVYQDSSINNSGHLWNLKHLVGDYFMIYAASSNYCLDVANGQTANGTNIKLYTASGNKAQIFRLKKINTNISTTQNAAVQLPEGIYTISTALNSSMVLDVASGSTKDYANIQLYKNSQSDAQKYIVRQLSNGNYTLMALNSKKMLTVDGGNVCQHTDKNSTTQEWQIFFSGNGYYTLKSVANGKVLDVANGKTANGTNIKVYTSNFSSAQRFKFTPTSTVASAKFLTDANGNYSISYNVYTKGNESSADEKYHLMLADSYSKKIYGSPLTSFEKAFDVDINLFISERRKLKEIAMNKLVLAVKQSNGSYKAINEPVSISNPEAIAKNNTAIFKASSKKGLQGVSYASNGTMPVDARYANTKQTLLNLDIADIVNPKSNYTTYTYKGKTYKFSKCSDMVANVKSMNAGYQQYLYGNSGNTKVSVSLCLLLSYDSANSYLIDPSARSIGHRYYTLNVREANARETLEALFVYLGELFGQEDCYVTNWILGNEINSSKAWNYSGSLSFDNYMNCYATAFQMLYKAVKSEKTGNTVSISLDNGWTAVTDTYAGKTTLDSFAKKIHAMDPNIEWSISYHPYSYPLTRADFWNDSSNTTNSTSTRYISMKNITVLTNYAASLEKAYKIDTGSIRVLLTEQGYSYGAGSERQAIAIARGYYIAEFNDRIDAFIIRAIVDDADEAKGKLYFGLMNSQQEKRTAFYVYEYMDSDLSKLRNTSASSVVTSQNYSKFNSAKKILCNTGWRSLIPEFNPTKLVNIK